MSLIVAAQNQPRHQEVFRAVVAEVAASLRLLQATKAPEGEGAAGRRRDRGPLHRPGGAEGVATEREVAHQLVDYRHGGLRWPVVCPRYSLGLRASPSGAVLGEVATQPLSGASSLVVARICIVRC